MDHTIFSNVSYQLEVYRDIYWVPLIALGKQLEDQAIENVIKESPEKKREVIRTLYDAVNLFITSEFSYFEDYTHHEIDGYVWELTESGYNAVRKNTGNCASNTVWLAYLLNNHFIECGVLGFIRPTGNGHILNYFKQGDWYYFIDMMTFEPFYKRSSFVENGNLATFSKRGFFTSGILKTHSIENYVKYFKKYLSVIGSDFLFYHYSLDKSSNSVLFPTARSLKQAVTYAFPRDCEIVIYPSSILQHEFIEMPDEISRILGA